MLGRSYCYPNKYNRYPFPKPAFSLFHKCSTTSGADFYWCLILGFVFYPHLDYVRKWYLAGKSSILFSFSFGHLCSWSLFIPDLLNKENTDFYYLTLTYWGSPCSRQVEFNTFSLCRRGTPPIAEAARAQDSPVHPSWPPGQCSSRCSHRPPQCRPGAQLPKGFPDA